MKQREVAQKRIAANAKVRKARTVNAYRAANQEKIEAWAKDNVPEPEVVPISETPVPFQPADAEEDRPTENQFAGVPWHEPDAALSAYFTGVRLNADGRALLATQRVGNETFEWHERPESRELGVYLWRKCGGSVVVMTKMTDLSPARCRDITMNAERIAASIGGTVETPTGDKLYVDSESLGLKMIATAAKAHERLVELIPHMEPKEALAAAKGLVDMGLILQGLPNVRTASVNEKLDDEKTLKKQTKVFSDLAERLSVVKGGA